MMRKSSPSLQQRMVRKVSKMQHVGGECRRLVFIADVLSSVDNMDDAELVRVAFAMTGKDQNHGPTRSWYQSLKIAKKLVLRRESLEWLRRVSRLPAFTSREVISTKVAKWLWQTSTTTITLAEHDELSILQCLAAADLCEYKTRLDQVSSDFERFEAFCKAIQGYPAAVSLNRLRNADHNSESATPFSLGSLRMFILDGGVTPEAEWKRSLAHVCRDLVNDGYIVCVPPNVLVSDQTPYILSVWRERLSAVSSLVTELCFYDPDTLKSYKVLLGRFAKQRGVNPSAATNGSTCRFSSDITCLRHRDIVASLVSTYVFTPDPSGLAHDHDGPPTVVGGTSALVFYVEMCFHLPIKVYDPLGSFSPDLLVGVAISQQDHLDDPGHQLALPQSWAAPRVPLVYQLAEGCGKIFVGDRFFGGDLLKICKEKITVVVDLSNGKCDSSRTGWPGFIDVFNYKGVEDNRDELYDALKSVLFHGQPARGLPPALEVLESALQRGKNVLAVCNSGVNR